MNTHFMSRVARTVILASVSAVLMLAGPASAADITDLASVSSTSSESATADSTICLRSKMLGVTYCIPLP